MFTVKNKEGRHTWHVGVGGVEAVNVEETVNILLAELLDVEHLPVDLHHLGHVLGVDGAHAGQVRHLQQAVQPGTRVEVVGDVVFLLTLAHLQIEI